MGRVLVAGSINLDIVVTAARHPRVGETIMGEEVNYHPGGKGSNQAVAAARSGVPTAFIGVLGRDAAGERLRAFLAECDVALDYLRTMPEVATGTAVIVVGGGDNAVVVVSGANAELSPEDVEGVPITPKDVLVSQFEIGNDTVMAFFQNGKDQGARIILNPSPNRECPPTLWALSDVIVVNEIELEYLCARQGVTGSFDDMLAAAPSLLVRDDQRMVVTLGRRGGVVASTSSMSTFVGRAVQVVDTTGAGDCFLGNMAGQLARGASVERAAHIANIAASLCVQRVGAGSSMPTAEEVLAASELD